MKNARSAKKVQLAMIVAGLFPVLLAMMPSVAVMMSPIPASRPFIPAIMLKEFDAPTTPRGIRRSG